MAPLPLGWTETDLALRRKGDRAKLALAVGLRSQTTMTLDKVTGPEANSE
jgi:hypothetical protein